MSKIIIETDQKSFDKILKRTINLSKEIELNSNKNRSEYIFFKLNNIDFAIDSNYLVETIFSFSIQDFPFLPNFIKGLINIRGNVIPVNDLSLLIFDKALEDKFEIVRVKYRNIDTSLAINSIEKIDFVYNDLIFSSNDIKTPKYTKKIIKNNNSAPVYILDLHSLFSDEKLIIKE